MSDPLVNTKLYYEALRCLPKRFIHGETRVCNWQVHKVIAANPNFTPIFYDDRTGKWTKIKLPSLYSFNPKLLKLR
jgi:hypothetical protein